MMMMMMMILHISRSDPSPCKEYRHGSRVASAPLADIGGIARGLKVRLDMLERTAKV